MPRLSASNVGALNSTLDYKTGSKYVLTVNPAEVRTLDYRTSKRW